eukprot:scaffold13530_cov22-Cyclotella_meneghiniana.AAC.2
MEVDDRPALTDRFSDGDDYDSDDDSQSNDPSAGKTSIRRTRCSYPLKLKKHIVSKVDQLRADNPKLTITKAMESMGY